MTYSNPKDDPRSEEELFECLLSEDEDVASKACMALHFKGGQSVFEKAKELCASGTAAKIVAGVDVLGQLGTRERPFYNESVEIFLDLLDTEKNPEILTAIGIAFSHNDCEKAIEPLCNLKNHESEDVRLGVVLGITHNSNNLAVETLIELTEDKDEEVRNWATFGIGTQIETDSPEIRKALAKRLEDSNEEIQGEAMYGLAVRKDSRAVKPIKDELSSNNPRVFALDSAKEMGFKEFLPLLRKLEKEDCDSYFRQCLEDAIKACTPK